MGGLEVDGAANVAAALFFSACLVIFVSGYQKLLSPLHAVAALRAAKLWANALVVRTVGMVEVIAAAIGLVAPSVGAPIVICLLVLFLLFLARVLLLHFDLQSCGCFVGGSSKPGLVHVVLDGVLLVAAIIYAGRGGPSFLSVVGDARASVVAILGIASLTLLVVESFRHLQFVMASWSGSLPATARMSWAERMQSEDDALIAAGITPDHPSLWGLDGN